MANPANKKSGKSLLPALAADDLRFASDGAGEGALTAELPIGSISEPFSIARATYEMARDDAREPVESNEENELLGRAHSNATDALLLTPAPDLSALAYKMQVFAAEDCHALSPQYREPLFAALQSDVRLLGGLSS